MRARDARFFEISESSLVHSAPISARVSALRVASGHKSDADPPKTSPDQKIPALADDAALELRSAVCTVPDLWVLGSMCMVSRRLWDLLTPLLSLDLYLLDVRRDLSVRRRSLCRVSPFRCELRERFPLPRETARHPEDLRRLFEDARGRRWLRSQRRCVSIGAMREFFTSCSTSDNLSFEADSSDSASWEGPISLLTTLPDATADLDDNPSSPENSSTLVVSPSSPLFSFFFFSRSPSWETASCL